MMFLLACLGGLGTSTPILTPELTSVLRRAHVAVFHAAPSTARLRLAVAQTVVEGAHFSRCHNLGGVSATRRQPHYRWHGVGQRMRAFPSFYAAAQAYWRAALRCPATAVAFDAGEPRAAARALAACRYFTADREAYGRAMEAVLKGMK